MKKNIILWFLAFICFANNLKAQISYGGTPTSFGSNFRKSALEKVALTPFLLPVLDVEKIATEDRSKPNNRFAKATFADITPEKTGLWQTLPTGDRLWRVLLQAQTEQVTGMCLRFDKFYIPQGGKLFVYTADKAIILGAFTHESNQPSGVFATTLIRGREVILEYYEPKEVKGQLVLSLNRIDQAYKNTRLEKPKGAGKRVSGTDFGEAAFCTIDINCSPLGSTWQDEKRGVVRIILVLPDGAAFCSGSLIGNTALNDTPYLLTADHCAEGVTTAMLNQWTFDFNYEMSATNCSSNVEPTPQSMTGAQVKANSFNSDFYLLQLNQAIPTSYNAYFNGWDKTTAASATGTLSIHHPSGDVKKFSLDTGTPVSSDDNGNTTTNGNYWKVTWNNGITEGGSSGSPLFSNTSKGRIVGQLLGGSSFCTPVTAQDDPDLYGKISTSWAGDGTPATRLSNWLDPNNTGASTLDGRYVGSIVTTTFLPALNATNVSASSSLQMTFNKPVSKGTGNIVLKRGSDNSIIETIPTTSNQVTTAGNTATIIPTNPLPLSAQIYVEIANTAFKDANNTNYAGIVGNSTWIFQTNVSTATEENAIAKALTIYPNPTDRFATIQVSAGTVFKEATLRVMDLAGKVLWNVDIKQLSEKQTFDWKALPAGKYLLEVQTKQGKAIKPFVKL